MLERNGLAVVDLEVVERLILLPVVLVVPARVAAATVWPVIPHIVRLIALQSRIRQLANLFVLSRHRISGSDTCVKLEPQRSATLECR